MTLDDYLLELYYLVDTERAALNLPRLRTRGPAPKLDDSEVLTMELAGEFLGIDTDAGIYDYFRRHHLKEFPRLAEIDRCTFARQCANLWKLKQLLQQRLLHLLPVADAVDGQSLWLVDSFPLRVCRFKRAPSHKLFANWAGYGFDPTAGRDRFFGFRVHLRVSDRGFCAAFTLASAAISDLPLVAEIAPSEGGVVLADANYWGLQPQQDLQQQGLQLLAPFRHKRTDPKPLLGQLIGRMRQMIEPVIGQLATRFHCQRTWARDLWHLCSRLSRKILSHTAAVLINWRAGNPPLQLALLLDR